MSVTRQTCSEVTPGEDRRMSGAGRRLSPDSGTPDTFSRMSPILSLPVSQAGCRGNIFLTLMRFVQGAGASGPPSMENPSPKEFLLISTSNVLLKSENSGTRRVFGF